MISLTSKTRRLGLSMAVAGLFALAPAAQAALLDGAVSAEGAAAVNATVAAPGSAAPTQAGWIAKLRFGAVAAPPPAALLFAAPTLLGLVGVARRKHAAGLAG